MKWRYRKTEALESAHEEARYIASVPGSHGHMVLKPA